MQGEPFKIGQLAVGQDWASQEFEGRVVVTVEKNGEVSRLDELPSEKKEIIQKLVDQAKVSGQRVNIVIHTDESMAYISKGDGGVKMGSF